MNIKKFRRELNSKNLPVHGDCNFCDWLTLWGSYCEEYSSKGHPYCNHLIKQKEDMDIEEYQKIICNDYLSSMSGPLSEDYNMSNYNHCYKGKKIIKKKLSNNPNKIRYTRVTDKTNKNYKQK